MTQSDAADAIPQPDSSLIDSRTPYNLPVIKRLVPNCTRIITSASYCNVYEIIRGSWDRPEIEGPIFILELNVSAGSTKYCAFIMNRKSPINILIPLPNKTDNIDLDSSELISIQLDDSQLLQRNQDAERPGCFGLRVYSELGTSTEKDRQTIGDEILRLVTKQQSAREMAPLTDKLVVGRRVSLTELFGKNMHMPTHVHGPPMVNYGYQHNGY